MDPIKPDFNKGVDLFLFITSQLQENQLAELKRYFISLSEEIKNQYHAPLLENQLQAQAFALRHLIITAIDVSLQEKLLKIRNEKNSEQQLEPLKSFYEWQQQLFQHNEPMLLNETILVTPLISQFISQNLSEYPKEQQIPITRHSYAEIDNKKDGNCLFYAYGISLIHYLKKEKKDEITHSILDKVPALSLEEREIFHSMIHKVSALTHREYDQIQEILSPKLRLLAVERLRKEFKENPKKTNLYAVACYCAEQVLHPTAPNTLFTDTEFYKLPALKEDLINYISMISQEESVTTEQLQTHVINYFLKDGDKQLNLYLEHLNTDKQWGTDEQLFGLHRAITNERELGEEGFRHQVYDNDIHLLVSSHEFPIDLSTITVNGIILRNIDNRHWTSLIANENLLSRSVAPLISPPLSRLQPSSTTSADSPIHKDFGQKAPLISHKQDYERERNRFAAKKTIARKTTEPSQNRQNPTIGFEVEMDGTRLPPEIHYLIEITKQGKAPRLIAPDEYLKKYDINSSQIRSMYDVQIMRALLKSDELCSSCKEKDYSNCESDCPILFDIVLDSSTGKEKQSLYLPEFRTEPLNLLTPSQEIKEKIAYFSSMINHFVMHHQNNEKKSLSSWSQRFDLQQPKHGDLQCFFDIDTALEPKEGYQAKMVFNKAGFSFDPIFAVHINLNVPPELLFSFQMFQLFEIRDNYPFLASNLKKEWPSSNPPIDYIDYMEALTIENETHVNHFLNEAKQAYSKDCSINNIAGVIRTLSFIYRLTQFLYNEEVFEQYFPQSVFIDDCNKDFFIAGLPKFNLASLVTQHLSTNEQDFLKYILSIPSLITKLTRLFKTPDYYCLPEISIGEKGELCTNIKISVSDYISETLIKPLSPEGTTKEIKCFIQKTIDDALVVEFRAPKSLGYQAKDIEQMLMAYIDNASLFTNTKYQELNPDIAASLMQQKALQYFGLNPNFSEEDFSQALLKKLNQNPNADRLKNHLKIIEDLIEKQMFSAMAEDVYSSDDESEPSCFSERQETLTYNNDDDLSEGLLEPLNAPMSPIAEDEYLSYKDLYEWDSHSLFQHQTTGMRFDDYPTLKSQMDIDFADAFKKPEIESDSSFYAKEKSSSFLFWSKSDLDEKTLDAHEKPKETSFPLEKIEIDTDIVSEKLDADLSDNLKESKESIESFSLPVGYFYIPQDKLFMASSLSAANESQEERLRWLITASENSSNPQSLFATQATSRFNLALETWENLFTAILHEGPAESKKIIATYFFDLLNKKQDALYLALITTHDKKYLKDLIHQCCSVYNRSAPFQDHPNGTDVMVNKHLFELYIRDLITSIENTCPIQLNLGLPTHHAKSDEPSGFCFINKLAVLASFNHQQWKASSPEVDNGLQAIRHVFVGLDVNQDDGLHQVLNENATFNYHHIDVFDENVFPFNDLEMIYEGKSKPLKPGGKRPRTLEPPVYKQGDQRVGYQITHLKKHDSSNSISGFDTNYVAEAQVYSALALNAYQRSKDQTLHPTMMHIFTLLEQEIKHHNHLIFYIPLGFDSHIKDKTFDSEQDTKETKQGKRFTTNDFIIFYKKLLSLYKAHPKKIKAIYISLEGGYDKAILSHELKILIKKFDAVNHARYQTLNNQIITNIHNAQWAPATEQLHIALNNKSINATEKYNLLSQLLFVLVESQQVSKAQLIYNKMARLKETIQFDDVTRKTSESSDDLSSKRSVQSSFHQNQRNYFLKLKGITRILLNNNIYTEENAQKIKLIAPTFYNCTLSILMKIEDFRFLTQTIFDQVFSLLTPSSDSVTYDSNDLNTLEKVLALAKEPNEIFALLTKSLNPSINMDLVFILSFLVSDKEIADLNYLAPLSEKINVPGNTLFLAFNHLHINRIKLLPEHIDLIIQHPKQAYSQALKIVQEHKLTIGSLTSYTRNHFRKVKGATPDISVTRIESLYSQYETADAARYVDSFQAMRIDSGNNLEIFINKIFSLIKFTLNRTTSRESSRFFVINELNAPEIFLNTRESRERFLERHTSSVVLTDLYEAHFQSPVLHREAYMYFIHGLINDRRSNALSAIKSLTSALRYQLPEEGQREAINAIIKNAILYFHQFEILPSTNTSRPFP